MHVEDAVEPEIILWENYGVKSTSRFLRIIFYFVFVFMMLLICFYVVYELEQLSNRTSRSMSDQNCRTNVDPQSANLDYYEDTSKRTGDFECFCKQTYQRDGFNTMISFIFPLDGKKHCPEWFNKYILVASIVIGILFLIIIGNIIVELLVLSGASLTRPRSELQIVMEAIFAISMIQFINLALVLLLTNIRIPFFVESFWLPAGIFQGGFEDFSSMWYLNVGSSLGFAMILEIMGPQVVPIYEITKAFIKRCYDRRCSCDSKKSRKLI